MQQVKDQTGDDIEALSLDDSSIKLARTGKEYDWAKTNPQALY